MVEFIDEKAVEVVHNSWITTTDNVSNYLPAIYLSAILNVEKKKCIM